MKWIFIKTLINNIWVYKLYNNFKNKINPYYLEFLEYFLFNLKYTFFKIIKYYNYLFFCSESEKMQWDKFFSQNKYFNEFYILLNLYFDYIFVNVKSEEKNNNNNKKKKKKFVLFKTYHNYGNMFNQLANRFKITQTPKIFFFNLHLLQITFNLNYQIVHWCNFKLKTLEFLINFFKISIYFFTFVKNFLITGFLFIFLFYLSFFLFYISFLKIISFYIIFGFLFFWLFSTFNFFLKRYKYSKYTSAIQRFWKRAFMCFWLIEGLLFTIFFYYLINASSEPLFIYDTYGLYLGCFIKIKFFLLNSFLIVLLLNIFIFLLINIKFTSLKKNLYIILLITFILIYILISESYQFYYLLNFYSDYIWNFSEDDNVWELDYDIPRTRTKNHYLTLLMVAKFWHYIFIFISWIFFCLKTLELNRIRYAFLSMNFQNIILFYIMNWLCMYAWLKWIFRRFMDQTYYWFFTSFRPTSVNIIINDLLLYLLNIVNKSFFTRKSAYNCNFIYMFITNTNLYGSTSFFKTTILPIFIN